MSNTAKARPAPLYRTPADLAATLKRARRAVAAEIAATHSAAEKIAGLVNRLQKRAAAGL
ncbi:hypothetical protein SAMN06265338_12417 [Rhodoblastus acidophilus]|uniref:Uncharacterized protein n=1 Tax=Rhodoblastus acidophilus TaxID=1074 RepID=A0A212SC07_RHOAC|nr:hypothetical protein [Rhodoblastus acidophilus]MCW2315295.1 hypothetical protein [Rhodoblastus acidophilus]PPQ35414.1 hypothetical protein CKO16_20645 [Rhodoblastus acidophilus]RAI17039.1 hypothetical protein CH337_18260 [Rhodoblastus acidophilus]SNB83070.1 hypothetical protein SAMN06265338_12417 [Rhodoblastus acidophilus]